jgi:hypothetical protein
MLQTSGSEDWLITESYHSRHLSMLWVMKVMYFLMFPLHSISTTVFQEMIKQILVLCISFCFNDINCFFRWWWRSAHDFLVVLKLLTMVNINRDVWLFYVRIIKMKSFLRQAKSGNSQTHFSDRNVNKWLTSIVLLHWFIYFIN